MDIYFKVSPLSARSPLVVTYSSAWGALLLRKTEGLIKAKTIHQNKRSERSLQSNPSENLQNKKEDSIVRKC